VALVARGARNLDGGEEPVRETTLQQALRRQARMIYVEATVGAALLTLLAVAAPA
jgi:hypothetical protein